MSKCSNCGGSLQTVIYEMPTKGGPKLYCSSTCYQAAENRVKSQLKLFQDKELDACSCKRCLAPP